MIALAAEDRRDLQRWLICGALVLAVHAAGIASLVQWHEPIDEGEYGGDTVVLELTPEQEQGVITPQTPLDQPEDMTAPLPEEDSEVTLPAKPPDPSPRPVENQSPDLITRAQQAQRLRAGAAAWDTAIAELLEHNKRYPADARARGEQGVTELAFSIDRDGHLLSSRIIKSSGVAALDEETLALVRRAQPFPPPPPGVPGDEIKFTVPVRFAIH